MRRVILALAAALLPALAGASVASLPGTNLVTNGGFEDYPQNNGTWANYASGRGWTVGSGGVEIRDNVSGRALEGSNFAELDTTKNSSIFQDIATEVGSTYELSFSFSNRTGVAVASNGLDWWFGEQTGNAPALVLNNSGNNQWNTFSVQLTANATLTQLGFRATGTSDSYGTSLDDVELLWIADQPTQSLSGGAGALSGGGIILSPVPEPEQGLMLLAGMAVLALARRRRKA
jgi:hypothetical protein